MPLFEWTADLSVGIEEFDSHHKRLVQLINKLHDSIHAKDENIVIEEVLAELSNYTLYHFFAEEDIMQRYEYPQYFEHRKEHLSLTEKTLDFIQDLHNKKAGLSVNVLDFLKEWLRHHILETDKNYAPFLNHRGVL
jgi:hemerythrin